ncbi:MAG: flagellar export chaperone FliS [Lachnospiraceae bacterium]
MAQGNPYAKYANNKITTATPAELTLMLYEGAIKFCNLAKIDMEKGEYGDALHHVQRARNIIVELQSTLDFKYPVAKDFDVIYTYIFNLMIECNKNHNIDALEEILLQLRELRDIWKQVMRQAKQPVS